MYGEPELRKEFEEVFGQPLTLRQLWAIVKLSKRVRLRARNNAAFNNLFSRLFPYASFRQVTKTNTAGRSYPGLSIQVAGEVMEQDEEAEAA